MINPLIISRLIEAGMEVFLPVDGGKEFVVREKDGRIKICVGLNAAKDGTNNSLVKIKGIASSIAVCDKVTRTVWFLPEDCDRPRDILRLGVHYEEFIIPEPNSLCYLEQKEKRKGTSLELLKRAQDIGERLGGKEDGS